MRVRFIAMAAAFAGFAALTAPASASTQASTDGRMVVAQMDGMRGGRTTETVRIRERRMMHRGPERCRVTVVRERTRNGMVERRIRRCR